MIKHFTDQGHKVTVVSLVRSEEEASLTTGIKDHCHQHYLARVGAVSAWTRMLLLLPTRSPSSYGYFYSPEIENRVRSLCEEQSFDLIFVHCSSVAQYVEKIQGIPKILDYGDMDSQKWLIYSKFKKLPLSLGYLLEGSKLQRDEARLAGRFDFCTCTTKAELETLNSYNTGVSSDWFPNGVDSEFFHLAKEQYDPDTICFIGRMDYYPNQLCMFDFCRDTFPLIKAARPQTKLLIVGAEPPASVRKLGEIDGVTVTGSVPDVRPYVHRSALTVAPLKIARGTQNKILESMAMGVPAVVSIEASGGIDAVPGEHVLVADSPLEYRDAILALLDNPAQREKLSKAARERVLIHHDWSNSMKRMDAIVERCLQQNQERL